MNNTTQTQCTASFLGTILTCGLFLTGCTGHGFRETALPTRIDYLCANNRVMKVERAKDASAAAVLVDNKPVILQRVSSPAQEKYTDGTYLLYLQGERAMLEKNSQVLFGPCSAGPLPKTVRDGFSGR